MACRVRGQDGVQTWGRWYLSSSAGPHQHSHRKHLAQLQPNRWTLAPTSPLNRAAHRWAMHGTACPLVSEAGWDAASTRVHLPLQACWPHWSKVPAADWGAAPQTGLLVAVSHSPSPLLWKFQFRVYPELLCLSCKLRRAETPQQRKKWQLSKDNAVGSPICSCQLQLLCPTHATSTVTQWKTVPAKHSPSLLIQHGWDTSRIWLAVLPEPTWGFLLRQEGFECRKSML